MCGIVGYTGENAVKDILIEGLSRLEYRGYDSAGVAIQQGDKIEVVCRKGKVSELQQALAARDLDGTCGIGHTRWATHGKPSEVNAHPHTSCSGDIAVVHNGIIENFAELREDLIARGHEFVSETDTEVIAHLIEEAYAQSADQPDCSVQSDRSAPCLREAVAEATTHLVGSFGLAVMCDREPGTIVACRKDSPIVVGRVTRAPQDADAGAAQDADAGAAADAGAPQATTSTTSAATTTASATQHAAQGSYVASDVIAMLGQTSDIVVLADGQIAELTPTDITYYDELGNKIEPPITHVDWDLDAAEKGGWPDFMMKEIYEQPRVIRDTLAGRLENGVITIDELDMSPEELNLIDRVYIIACGTSYHAGLIAKNLIEGWARIPCEVEVASEFRYRNPIITPTTLVVAISQSGETADTLAAIRDARVKGAKVFSVTNVVGSPVARESDGVIYTKANKEIAVASTKSFLGQVVSLTLLAMLLAQAKGKITTSQVRLFFRELADTAAQVEYILANDEEAINEAAHACKDAKSALFIGRGMGSAISYEGALKLKEISYLHAEAYAAGEMKHGPIALIDEGFPIIAIATKSPVYDKVISNLQEARARGAMVVAIATEGDEDIRQHADHVIYIPKVRDAFSAITATVPLQLFARAIALERGCDVDQPRNLAKSVTVE